MKTEHFNFFCQLWPQNAQCALLKKMMTEGEYQWFYHILWQRVLPYSSFLSSLFDLSALCCLTLPSTDSKGSRGQGAGKEKLDPVEFLYRTVPYTARLSITLQYNTIKYSTLYCHILYCTALHSTQFLFTLSYTHQCSILKKESDCPPTAPAPVIYHRAWKC